MILMNAMNYYNNVILKEISEKLGINSDWLHDIINFESNFNPYSKNPYSSAKGILQFIDSTARDLGFSSSQDLISKNPTIEQQLKNAVYPYLKKYLPFKSFSDLAMSIFYPAYRYKNLNTIFPESVQKANPGIKTIEDYIKKIYTHNKKLYISNSDILFTIILIGGVVWITKKKK